MNSVTGSKRILFIDYFRAFLVCLVVLDHAMHAYSEHYARFWFLPDFDRNAFFDVLHLIRFLLSDNACVRLRL